MDTASLSAVSSASSQFGNRSAGVGSAGSTASTQKITDAATEAANRYSSPVMSFDTVTGDIIWQYRDPETGDNLYQSPSRATLLYERSQRLAQEQNHGTKGSGQTVSFLG